MPDPPPVGLLTRFVLENPYPLGVVLLAVAAVTAWSARGRRQVLAAGGLLGAFGAAVIVTGVLVTTSGERARDVVLDLVAAAEAGDVAAAAGLFADDAGLSFGSPRNPAYSRERIQGGLEQLDDRFRIASNHVSRLDAYTESADRGTVHLGCVTTLEGGFGPTPSQWVLVVERLDGGAWKVRHVTWVTLAGRAPSEEAVPRPPGWPARG